MWDDADGLYYDKLISPDGTEVPVKVRSMVGIIPLLAAVILDEIGDHPVRDRRQEGRRGCSTLAASATSPSSPNAGWCAGSPASDCCCSASSASTGSGACSTNCSTRTSSCPRTACAPCRPTTAIIPYRLEVEGISAIIDYEPAESTTSMFGGNSNWRGPLWFPLNFLVVSTLERYYRFFGDDFEVEYPTRSGTMLTLDKIADDLRERLVSLFLVGPDGRRPSFGMVDRLQHDPAWKDNLVFSEYFHGDNGAGLGAAHQTGWTGVVADLIRGRPGNGVFTVGEIARVLHDRQAEQ